METRSSRTPEEQRAPSAPLVFALISLVMMVIFAPAGIVFGIIGFAMAKNAQKEHPTSELLQASAVSSLVGIIACAVVVIITIVLVNTVRGFVTAGVTNVVDMVNQFFNNLLPG